MTKYFNKLLISSTINLKIIIIMIFYTQNTESKKRFIISGHKDKEMGGIKPSSSLNAN